MTIDAAYLRPDGDAELAAFSNPEVVWQQFTGLFDKSGREIFEGDIIRHLDQKWVRPVGFYDGAFPAEEWKHRGRV